MMIEEKYLPVCLLAICVALLLLSIGGCAEIKRFGNPANEWNYYSKNQDQRQSF